ncbi:DUF1127 domain-containing protein [Sulfitobacter sp. D35]|uniref:DUF1127 domain-containing protein n=1 Tax=Sulfitobacter sp. D35 TaxID=3083252 RepID=UPI00296ED91A|nr:DUF1127 domain-containing protein [Sulfitobacter sp. D35]MDW4499599.1 DUF1127 domain-containing protein [Sulfitobacter sp. D35]
MAMLDLISGRTRTRRTPKFVGGLISRIALQKSRRRLGELDAKALQDIGVSPEDARREASRGFWDAPSTWRHR